MKWYGFYFKLKAGEKKINLRFKQTIVIYFKWITSSNLRIWNGCIIKCTGESVEQFQSLMSAGASHHLYRVYARGV